MTRPADVTVEDLLRGHDAGVIATARRLRRLVTSAVPEAGEKVWAGWHGVGYRHPQAGFFCGIFPNEHSVALYFEHGAHLPDPAGLLSGNGRRGRSVVFQRPDEIPADQIIELIDAAIEYRG